MKSAIAIFGIALFVLLPLYELVDYNEHWPNDGHFVAVIFTILFIVEIPRILRTVSSVVLRLLQSLWRMILDSCSTAHVGRSALLTCTSGPLFLRLCDFRI